jgi:hypothetical protein
MDAQTATLLCLGCPAGTMFGIDTMQWKRARARRRLATPAARD